LDFRPKRFTVGTLQSKLPLIIIVAVCILNRQIGVKVSKFLVVSGLLNTGHVIQRMRYGHFFTGKRFTVGTLRGKLPLIIIVAPWKLYSE